MRPDGQRALITGGSGGISKVVTALEKNRPEARVKHLAAVDRLSPRPAARILRDV